MVRLLSSNFSLRLQQIQTPCVTSRLLDTYIQKISLLLGGRVVSENPTLISSTQRRCFSSSLQSSAEATPFNEEQTDQTAPRRGIAPLLATPWLMVPPTLVPDRSKRDAKYCPHCKSTVIGSVDRSTQFKVKPNSEVKPGDDDYYQFLNAADNNTVFKKKKNLWMPWQTDHLLPDEAICIGSSHGWLAYIHPRNCSLYLYNPLIDSSMPYLPLPPIETLPPIMSSRRLNGMHIDSSSSSVVTEFMIWKQMLPISAKNLSDKFFKKIIMSSAPTSFSSNHYDQLHINNNINNVDQDSHCTVMAIYGNEHPQRLAFCRIGDTSWTALDSPLTDSYEDLLYFSKKKLFYALCCHGSVESWDLTNPSSPKRALAINTVPRTSSCSRYLVESSGDLLMVIRNCAYRLNDSDRNIITSAFSVYKRDFVENKWINVPSLDDNVLFIGQNHAVSLSAHDFPGLRKNSIYFTQEYLEEANSSRNSWGCWDLGIFNLEDESLYVFDLRSEIQAFPIWVVPHL